MNEALHASSDRSLAEAPAAPEVGTQPETTPRHPRLVLATTILASSLAFIDGSVVNVGLPAIGRSLGAAEGDLAWVVNAYMLPLSALLLVGGAAGDLYGRRRLLCLGIALFAVASLLCALAPSLTWLNFGRGLQGVGAAMLMPNSLAILAASFDGPARGRAIGIWAAVAAAAGAIGPLVGGWLIDAIGWRAIFLVNLPLALVALLLAWRFVADQKNEDRPPLDVAGAVLVSAALGALTWGLTVASGKAGLHWPAVTALVVGVVCLALFLRVEDRLGDHAMMPLALFTSRAFAGLTVLTLLVYGALGAMLVLVPYVLIEFRGYSATAAGAALLPLPIVIALVSPAMGRLAGKIGPRWPLTAGPLVVGVGLLLTVRVVGSGSYWTTMLPAMLVMAFGMGATAAPLTTAVLGSVRPNHTGVASGLNSAVARTGGLIATALLAATLASHGAALASLFRLAVVLAAGAAIVAGIAAFVSLGRLR